MTAGGKLSGVAVNGRGGTEGREDIFGRPGSKENVILKKSWGSKGPSTSTSTTSEIPL